MFLPKVYPITNPRLTKLSHAEQVKRLIEGGARLIQLREKHASPKDFYEASEEAMKITRASNARIIINDRVDIALAVGAAGIHLGQDDLPPSFARKILGENAIIGFSTHNLEQVFEAVKLPIDYLAIGPVFATATKKNAEKPVGVEMIKKTRQAIGNFPLVAIGGITFENFKAVLSAGANSVAIINDLLFEPDKIAATMKKFSV